MNSDPRHGTATSTDLCEQECRGLLSSVSVGRIGWVEASLPQILPVNFALLADRIVFRTEAGSRLAAGVDDAPVVFEVDSARFDSLTAWSVIVAGQCTQLEGRDRDTMLGRLTPWATGAKDQLFAIDARTITGRRLHHPG